MDKDKLDELKGILEREAMAGEDYRNELLGLIKKYQDADKNRTTKETGREILLDLLGEDGHAQEATTDFLLIWCLATNKKLLEHWIRRDVDDMEVRYLALIDFAETIYCTWGEEPTEEKAKTERKRKGKRNGKT